jgi:PEGA domain
MRFGHAITAISVTLTGCASTIHHAPMPGGGDAMQIIAVTSTPDGAEVYIGDRMLGVTPLKIPVKRKAPGLVLRFERTGYESIEVPLKRTTSEAVAGNLAFALIPLNPLQGLSDNPWSTPTRTALAFALPLAGLTIDAITGGAYNLPPHVHATLHPRHPQHPALLAPSAPKMR